MTLNTTLDNLPAGKLPTVGERPTAGEKGGAGGLPLNITLQTMTLRR
jgi:hypothetical protein